MKTFRKGLETQWRDWVNLVIGVWLFVSPWVLAHLAVSQAAWNAWVLGVVIAVAALVALVNFHEWEEWVSAALGVWLVISPWVLGYTATAAATWNHVVTGLVVAGLACWTIWSARHRTPQTV